MSRRVPWWPVALGSFLVSFGAFLYLPAARRADSGDTPAARANEQAVDRARVVPADPDAIDGVDEPPPQEVVSAGQPASGDASISSADISAAVVRDAAFRAAIEDGLNDPDPQIRQETAELFDHLERASRGLEPRDEAPAHPPSVNNPSRDRNTPPLPSDSER